MAKQNDNEQVPVIGWFQPHVRPQWTGMLVNEETGELVPDPAAVSMTKQSFKDECDINNIVKKFEAGMAVDHINQAHASGVFTDLPDAIDFQEGLHRVMAGQQAFMALPANIRARFENDPAQFLAFFNDPANQEEMISLGLAKDLRPPPPANKDEKPKEEAKADDKK